MSPPLARAFARIASTLFAFAALVLIGFVTSPAGFAAGDLPPTLLVHQEAATSDDSGAPQVAGDQDEPSSFEAMMPETWQIAERPQSSWTMAGPRLGAATGLSGPDRPPPRHRSDLRSGSLGML
ncbi:hypothetical protein [Aureimonas sp. AU40]|uniref:hypothetical protein n=1 Tax=Aureimonas sp. AU40 TaxID=1637747 RepID=UPI000781F5B3|nr:hypothetical protein [Aureimonas sp. AU40]